MLQKQFSVSFSVRTKKQFTEFRRAFKKWRAKWIKQVYAYRYNKEIDEISIYDSNLTLLSGYVAPGYLKYMKYQFRGFKKIR